jgi:catecholate siderophore receptor
LFVLSSPATASDATAVAAAEAADMANLDPIIVTGQRAEYGIKSTSTATRTETEIKDIPQAMTVISESQIEDQSLRSVADLLLFVPGATPGTGEANRDQLTLRGNNTTADFFRDGIRDDVQYFRDFYNVDRVEVLRGPNAMIFGRGGGGGIINRVTKRASLGRHYEAIGSLDTEGGYRLSADVDQPLTDIIGARLNAVYENGESFRRHVELERYGINPTVGLLVTPETRVDLSYEYFHDSRTTDRGVPSLNGEPLEGYDRTFFGDPDESFSKADVNIATFAVSHDFGGGLTLRNRTLLGDYDKFYQNVFPSALVGTTQVRLGAYNSRNDRRNLISQTDMVYEGPLAGIDQTLLVGFEVGRQTSRNQRLTGTIDGGNLVPLADPTVDLSVTYARSNSDADNRTRATVGALYVQEQLRPTEWLEIVAGLRFDRFKLSVNDERVGVPTFSREDEFFSPRLGLVLKPQEKLSVYASYSRSYLPQSGEQFSALTDTTAALKPERFDNIEVGAKWEPVPGLLATAALYRLDRSNTRAPSPDPTLPTVLTGEQRTRGLELGLERSISNRWQVSAGYAWQDSEIRNPILSGTTTIPAGRKVPLVPKHSASVWTRYQLAKPFGLGLGVVARTKSFAAISNEVTLPGFVRVDAAGFFKVAPGVQAQVNVENLLGTDYFAAAHSDNNIAPGAPRTARATLRFGF